MLNKICCYFIFFNISIKTVRDKNLCIGVPYESMPGGNFSDANPFTCSMSALGNNLFINFAVVSARFFESSLFNRSVPNGSV